MRTIYGSIKGAKGPARRAAHAAPALAPEAFGGGRRRSVRAPRLAIRARRIRVGGRGSCVLSIFRGFALTSCGVCVGAGGRGGRAVRSGLRRRCPSGRRTVWSWAVTASGAQAALATPSAAGRLPVSKGRSRRGAAPRCLHVYRTGRGAGFGRGALALVVRLLQRAGKVGDATVFIITGRSTRLNSRPRVSRRREAPRSGAARRVGRARLRADARRFESRRGVRVRPFWRRAPGRDRWVRRRAAAAAVVAWARGSRPPPRHPACRGRCARRGSSWTLPLRAQARRPGGPVRPARERPGAGGCRRRKGGAHPDEGDAVIATGPPAKVTVRCAARLRPSTRPSRSRRPP